MDQEHVAGEPGLEVQQAPAGDARALAPVMGNSRRARTPRAGAGKQSRCGATTAAGAPCDVRPLTGHPSARCRLHAAEVDPHLAQVVALERSQGGKALRVRRALGELGLDLAPDFQTAEGIQQAMEVTAAAVARGAIPASVAGAISQLAGVALRAAEAKVERDLKELERRIEEELEQRR